MALGLEGSSCGCGLGPVSLRFVQPLGSGWVLGPWIQESTGLSEALMTRFLLFCHMCEMDVGCLEWEGSDGGTYKELGRRDMGIRPTHTFVPPGPKDRTRTREWKGLGGLCLRV